MGKYIKITAAVAGVAVLAVLAVLLLRGDDFKRAVRDFDKGNYEDSIKLLNRLAKTADYDPGERIYYYRCRALNALADSLERKYGDELKAVVSVSEQGRQKEKQYLDKKLASLNGDLDADLALVIQGRSARIVSRGKFYDEFASRYKGSRYLEDLDLDEVRKVEKTEPRQLLNAISGFYRKYPRTMYIPQLVKMIFAHMREGIIPVKGREDFIRELIMDFASRYPTSAEVQRLFQCTGNDVNLRNSPGVEGSLVGKVKKGEILLQLEKSMDTQQVGDVRDYWYRVSTMRGIRGWIFGKFLEALKVEKVEGRGGETWGLEEYFREWEDSNTPGNWMHIVNGDRSAVSFSVRGEGKIVKLNSPRGKRAGLFRRFAAGEAYTVNARGRFVAGDPFVLFAVVMGNNRGYYLRLGNEEIELSGRKIPLHSSDMHVYELIYEGGNRATLKVDGEVILSRVPPTAEKDLSDRGIYCCYSGDDGASMGELEYIKIK